MRWSNSIGDKITILFYNPISSITIFFCCVMPTVLLVPVFLNVSAFFFRLDFFQRITQDSYLYFFCLNLELRVWCIAYISFNVPKKSTLGNDPFLASLFPILQGLLEEYVMKPVSCLFSVFSTWFLYAWEFVHVESCQDFSLLAFLIIIRIGVELYYVDFCCLSCWEGTKVGNEGS